MLRSLTQIECNVNLHGYSVDIFVPEWSVAFEYQGAHHYNQTYRGYVVE
jgi:hypothetical protein